MVLSYGATRVSLNVTLLRWNHTFDATLVRSALDPCETCELTLLTLVIGLHDVIGCMLSMSWTLRRGLALLGDKALWNRVRVPLRLPVGPGVRAGAPRSRVTDLPLRLRLFAPLFGVLSQLGDFLLPLLGLRRVRRNSQEEKLKRLKSLNLISDKGRKNLMRLLYLMSGVLCQRILDMGFVVLVMLGVWLLILGLGMGLFRNLALRRISISSCLLMRFGVSVWCLRIL